MGNCENQCPEVTLGQLSRLKTAKKTLVVATTSRLDKG